MLEKFQNPTCGGNSNSVIVAFVILLLYNVLPMAKTFIEMSHDM